MKKADSNIKSTGIVLLLILAVMAVLIYINNLGIGGSKGAFKELRPIDLVGQLEASDKNSKICSLDELLIEAQGTVLKARNIKGDTIWNKSFAGQISIMKSSGANLYIVDGSKKLYCLSKTGKQLWEKGLKGDINDIYVDRSGDLLIDYRAQGGSNIHIISAEGIDEGSMLLDKAAVVAFASGKGENTISVVDISSEVLKTKLITLDLKGAMIWSDNFDNQVIPMVGYGKDNTLIAIGEEAILQYKGEQKKPEKLKLDKTIYSAGIDDEHIAIVRRNRDGFEAVAYDMSLKELGSMKIDKAPKGIVLHKGNYIIYYNEKLLVCDLKGSAKAEFKSIPSINSVQFTEDGSILAVSDKMIQKLHYQ